MDPELWKNLPRELLPNVLVRLPWWKILQLRGVCKSWNAMLSNPRFLSGSSPMPCSAPPCLVLSTTEEYTLVNFGFRKWYTSPQSSLLPGSRPADCFEISAATAGLFLMEGRDPELGRFLVNPLNKTQRRLPALPPLEGQFANRGTSLNLPLRMTVNEKTRNVRVLGVHIQRPVSIDVRGIPAMADLLLSDLELWNIYVYDMFRDSWEPWSKNLAREIFQSLENVVFAGDDLYLLTKKQGLMRPAGHTHSVLKAMPTNVVEVPIEFAANVPTVHIFQHRGVLMLASGQEQRHPSVDIWRLEDLGQNWVKVVSMPENLLAKFYQKLHHGIFNFDAEGDFVCFASYFNTDIVIVYNLVEQVWWELSFREYISLDLNFHDTFLWRPNLSIVL